VKNNRIKKFMGGRAARRIMSGLLVTAATLAVCGIASAQDKKEESSNFNLLPTPTTPANITPQEGNALFLVGNAVGTQGYVCLPKDGGASWTVNPARPEATLFTNFFGEPTQIITHFLSPNTNPNKIAARPIPFGNATWQSSFDSSKVWAVASPETTFPAGGDPSCPNAGSIACLLLQVVGAEQGPTGGKILTKTTFIQRLNTNGGSAPDRGCSVAGDVGHQALVPYTADYYFYHKAE
jgi:Protein of unknown function (DUF3455)